MATDKTPMSFRATADDLKLILKLQKKTGLKFPQLVRLGLRQIEQSQQQQTA